ncbi:hypothetical protein [Natronohydrobacter thiooxidans]|uniref:hypothetical protein n=1 Tax=Natronohydrobacter thiooxidans TaxID=87172 RepID=UPI0008FF4442|nr:hypothetical protein [Natronohydrobacter thiooxidans]
MRHPDIDLHVLRLLLTLALTGLALLGIAMARTEAQPRALRIPPPPDFELRLDAGGAGFHFEGLVDFGLTEALRGLVATHPEIRQLTLESHGGYISEARGAVTVLRAHGIATHVEGHCASACALIFAGGAARSLGPEARFGLHGYALVRERHFGMIDPVAEMQRDLAIYRAQGVEESFVARLADLPQVPMWYPSREKLRAAGMVTMP